MPGLLLGRESVTLALLFVGESLNGVAGPSLMASTAALSAVWFPAGQRSWATGIGTWSNNFGPAFGFLLALGVKRPGGVAWVMIVEAAISCSVLVLAAFHFPPAPEVPASASSSAIEELEPPSMRQIASLFLNRDVLFISIGLGGIASIMGSWSASFPQILAPSGVVTSSEADWLGFLATTCCMSGTAMFGLVADRFFHREFKRFAIGLCMIVVLFDSLFLLFIPIPLLGGFSLPGSGVPALAITVSLSSLAVGMLAPLAYELAAEITAPLPAGCSTTIIITFNCIVSVIFTFLLPKMGTTTANLVMVGTASAALIMMVFVREKYNRLDVDEPEQAKLLN
jgi:MFS family permease